MASGVHLLGFRYEIDVAAADELGILLGRWEGGTIILLLKRPSARPDERHTHAHTQAHNH